MLQSLHDQLALTAGIVGALGVLFATVPVLRRLVVRAAGIIKGYVTGPLVLQQLFREVMAVKAEVMYNGGGSMKDIVAGLRSAQQRQENYRRQDFWSQGRPALELDGDGHVNLSSEAMLRLFHVSSPEDLHRRSWLRFLDSEEVDEFLSAFISTARADSMFRFEIGIRGSQGEDRGRWVFRAVPIKPDIGGTKLYSGHWAPIDEQARQIAARNGWGS
jgi:PAS domain-containing protein